MDISLTEQEFALLRISIEDMCGILVDENKAYLIESRLGGYAAELGCRTFGDFYAKIKNDADPAMRDKIIDLMTTNETLWFRDQHPYVILKEVLLPQFAREIQDGKRQRIRIWSSACSTGQEPYSLSMIYLEAMRAYPQFTRDNFEILATDISTSALRLAMLGRYDNIAIGRGLAEDFKSRYFKNEGRVWSIIPGVKTCVTLKKLNLQDSFVALGRFDIVLCRNVAIYFSEAFKRDLFSRIGKALNPDGILFLGASESISAYSSDYDMLEHNRGIYYRLRSR